MEYVCFEITLSRIIALFPHLYGEGKSAVISKLTYTWTVQVELISSRSYIVLALKKNALK